MSLVTYLRNVLISACLIACCILAVAAHIVLYVMANAIWGDCVARVIVIASLFACAFIGAWILGD